MKLIALALLLCSPLQAAVKPYLVDGLALQGYDAVSYLDEAKAEKGNTLNAFTYEGGTYLFSSPRHLEAFKKAPAKYAPAYGGWCAYAMSKGKLVEVDPLHFKVKDGRTCLFFYGFFNDTLKKWNADENALSAKAEENWKKLNSGMKP